MEANCVICGKQFEQMCNEHKVCSSDCSEKYVKLWEKTELGNYTVYYNPLF